MGAPAAVHLEYARSLLHRIPPEARLAARGEAGAQAVVLALLLAEEPGPVRDRQEETISELGGPELAAEVGTMATHVAAAGPDARLALLDLALPALHGLPEPRATAFRRAAQRLIREDGSVRIFDYALVHILARHLPNGRTPSKDTPHHIHSLQPVRDEVQLVLSAIAYSGAESDREADAAFAAAAARLPESVRSITLQPAETIDLVRVDRALQRLDHAAPGVRRRFVDACAHCVAFDGRVLPAEAETLRAVAEALDCPLPPLAALADRGVPA
jgi:hypothetical protein